MHNARRGSKISTVVKIERRLLPRKRWVRGGWWRRAERNLLYERPKELLFLLCVCSTRWNLYSENDLLIHVTEPETKVRYVVYIRNVTLCRVLDRKGCHGLGRWNIRLRTLGVRLTLRPLVKLSSFVLPTWALFFTIPSKIWPFYR